MRKQKFLVISSILLMLMATAVFIFIKDNSTKFIVSECEFTKENSKRLNLYLSDGTSTREVFFNGPPKNLVTFILPRQSMNHAFKGSLDWTDIEKVSYKKTANSNTDQGKLKLKSNNGNSTPIGVIDDTCWTKIKSTFESDLKFEMVK